MSVLTKKQILERVADGNITFEPNLDSFQLQGHSVDLRLGFTFMVPKTWHMTPDGRQALEITHFDKPNPDHFDIIELEKGQYFELLPNEYILAGTLESLSLPDDLMGILYPRSSTNRKGLSVDMTGIVDAGYTGQLILPISNKKGSQTIRLYPGERLCQIVFEELSESVEHRKSKYHKQDVIDGFKREDKIETELIKTGEIKQLKEKHGAS